MLSLLSKSTEKFLKLRAMSKPSDFASHCHSLSAPQKEYKMEQDFVGGCLDGSFVAPADFTNVEKMPTKLELITKIAMLIKAVPTKVARSVNAVSEAIELVIPEA